MGTVKMKNETGLLTNGLVLLVNRMQDEQKQIRTEVTGERQVLSEEDESGVNDDLEDVNDDGKMEDVQVQANGQAIQQQPQGTDAVR
ncbi:hypothetical protein SLE2022_069310 [Rubroshorea leprosula]